MELTVGFDSSFLGLPAPLPVPTDHAQHVELAYRHFTVLQRVDRRLAAVSAVNIHGGLLVDVPRGGDEWRLDGRLPADAQADNDLYRNNDFDRGHLTRRRDPCWGSASEAKEANDDTFHYTNAGPQAAVFNQSKDLWLGLEDYVLEHAATFEQRLSVFSGPIFNDQDPEYRGVQIPRFFYKIACWLNGTVLGAAGYVLDQSELVEGVIRAELIPTETPPLGQFKTFQTPIADIAELTGLAMPEAVAADVFSAPPSAGLRESWRLLRGENDFVV